jgi:hypothetical protein
MSHITGKTSHHFKKSLNSTESVFFKSLDIFKKASHLLEKASISLEMPSERIEIFTKASISLKVSEKCHSFLKKKASHSQKKALRHCYNGQSAPGYNRKLCEPV